MKKIFTEALEAPVEDRASVVRDRCNGNEDLEMEIIRLLESNETADLFLDDPLVNLQHSNQASERVMLP